MKSAAEWIAFVIFLIILYIMDVKHMAASSYNLFLIILICSVTALVVFLKICFRQSDQDEQNQ